MEGKGAWTKEIHRKHYESYSLLPSSVIQLLCVDPATLTHLVREVNGHSWRSSKHLDLVYVAAEIIYEGFYAKPIKSKIILVLFSVRLYDAQKTYLSRRVCYSGVRKER